VVSLKPSGDMKSSGERQKVDRKHSGLNSPQTCIYPLGSWSVRRFGDAGAAGRWLVASGAASNHVTNGLLLRADIHTLFDLGLLAPEPVTRTIVVSKLLVGTQYAVLSGSQLADPALARQRPNQEALEIVWQRFSEAEDGRLCR
jgi:hypothetical protein